MLEVVGLMNLETGLPRGGAAKAPLKPGLLAERCRPKLPGGGVLLGAGGSSIETAMVGEALELLLDPERDFL